VTGVREDLDARSGGPGGQVVAVGDRRDRVALAGQDQGRAADPRELAAEVVGEVLTTEEVEGDLGRINFAGSSA
jgi:hypothetical protein